MTPTEFSCRHVVWLDLETRSNADIKKTGAYPYALDPTTEITLLAYAIGDQEARVWDLLQDRGAIPPDLVDAMANPRFSVCAHSSFDRVVLAQKSHEIGLPVVPLLRWRDSMAICNYHGVPASLKNAALSVQADTKKMESGRSLIHLFAKPKKMAFFGDEKRFIGPHEKPEEWAQFMAYAAADVEAMRSVVKKLGFLPQNEEIFYRNIERMNDRGIPVDYDRTMALKERCDLIVEEASKQFKDLTGLDSPASPKFVQDWVSKIVGKKVGSVQDLPEILGARDCPDDLKIAVRLRSVATRAAIKKADALLDRAVPDVDGYRLKGGLIYCGAAMTQRMAGRGVQPQNFKRPEVGDDEIADFFDRAIEGADVPKGLESMEHEILCAQSAMRSLFAHDTGMAWADLSGIELRVGALMTDAFARHNDIDIPPEGDLVTAIKNGADLYIPTGVAVAQKLAEVTKDPVKAEKLRGINAENAKKEGWRGLGKTIVLSCQYGTGAARLQAAIGGEVILEEAQVMVDAFRQTHPQISEIWKHLTLSVIKVLKDGKPQGVPGFITYTRHPSVSGKWDIHGTKPSGSRIIYRNVRIEKQATKFGSERSVFCYDKSGSGPGAGREGFSVEFPHGGQLFEHAVSSISRDLLHHAAAQADIHGMDVFLAVHDELVTLGG